ncbi:GTPase Era [bacterium]|nr:GTPase Era [bacterium]
MKNEFRSGFVSIFGRPNAGKSTLMNNFLGVPLSSVSRKQQTTRNRITGILNGDDHQIVFLDTPGITKAGAALNRILNQSAKGALELCDIVLYVIDASRYRDDPELEELLQRSGKRVICALNQVDRMDKKALLPILEKFNSKKFVSEIIPISALKGSNLDKLRELLIRELPQGEMYYPAEYISANPEKFIIAEAVKGAVFNLTGEEIPYSTAVMVEKVEEKKKIIVVWVVIYVERATQKGMIIGKGGKMVSRIGTSSRILLEELFGKKFYLEIFVKVKPHWSKDQAFLKELGYTY